MDVFKPNDTPYLHSLGCGRPLSRGQETLCCSAPPPGPPPPYLPRAWAASAWCPAPRTRSGAAARLAAAAGDNLEIEDYKGFPRWLDSPRVTPATKLRFCGFAVVHFGIMF